MNAFRWMRRLDALEAREQLRVVVEGQAGVQAVDDVDLRDRIAGGDARAQLPPRLVVRHRVRALVARLQARERAEHAARLADVGGVDVQVAVEEGAVAVQALAHLVGQRADLEQVRVLEQRDAVGQRQRLARAHLVPDPGEAHAGTSCNAAVRQPLARDQAGAADQRRRLLARQRRVVGVVAQAQRALGDDRRQQRVGAEAERHLRQPRPQRRDVGDQVRHGGQRQPAEREAAQRVQAVGLADRRRHHAPQRRRRERCEPDQPLAVGFAGGERHAQQHAQPGVGRRRRQVGAGRDQQIGPRGARGGQAAQRRDVHLVDLAVGGVARPAPAAVAQQLPRARERAVAAEARVARGRRLPPEREQIQRGEGVEAEGAAVFFDGGRAHLPFTSSSPQRGASLFGSPTWSSTRPTTVSSSASSVAGFE